MKNLIVLGVMLVTLTIQAQTTSPDLLIRTSNDKGMLSELKITEEDDGFIHVSSTFVTEDTDYTQWISDNLSDLIPAYGTNQVSVWFRPDSRVDWNVEYLGRSDGYILTMGADTIARHTRVSEIREAFEESFYDMVD